MSTETVGTESSESFSPAEAAYFKSGGEDTSGLDAEVSGTGASPEPGQQAPQAQDADTGAADADGDGDGDELVTIGPDGKPRDDKGRFVPQAALHKERERRKATETELQAQRQQFARADERLAVLNEILGKATEAPAQQQQAAMPDPETDPIGALQHAFKCIETLQQQIADREQRETEKDEAKRFNNIFLNEAEHYQKSNPDFKDAVTFLAESRRTELRAAGFENREIEGMINEELRSNVTRAFKMQRSPAQLLHNLAKARGFTVVPKSEHQQPDVMEKLQKIDKGQRTAGASLTNAGGSSGEGLTTEALANMSEDEFAAVSRKLGKAKMAQYLGG
jgi:hypothetical protein